MNDPLNTGAVVVGAKRGKGVGCTFVLLALATGAAGAAGWPLYPWGWIALAIPVLTIGIFMLTGDIALYERPSKPVVRKVGE